MKAAKFRAVFGIIVMMLAALPMIIAEDAARPFQEEQATLSFGDVELNAETTVRAFTLSFASTTGPKNIKIDGKVSNELVFYKEGNDAKVFYRKGNGFEQAGSALPLTIEINSLPYSFGLFAVQDLIAADLLTTPPSPLTAETEIFALSTNARTDAMMLNGNAMNTLYPITDGSGVLAGTTEFEIKNLPLDISFNVPGATEEQVLKEVTSSAGEEAEAGSGSIAGCVDDDAGLGADSYKKSSFVIETYTEDGATKQKIRTDKCAVEETAPSEYKKTLLEWGCKDGIPVFEEIACSELGADFDCKNGACVLGIQASQRFCHDTDPLIAGTGSPASKVKMFTDTFSTKGVTYGFYASAGKYATDALGKDFGVWGDYCTDSGKELVEYSCSLDSVMYRSVICPAGCENGKCANPPYCFETDGGKQYKFAGTTEGIRAPQSGEAGSDYRGSPYYKFTDKCIDDTTLEEYFCDASDTATGYGMETHICEGKCNAGKCVPAGQEPEPECTTNADCEEGKACANEKCVAMKRCNECHAKLPFDLWEWSSETCDETEIPATATLLKCPASTYCDDTSATCVPEPKSTMDEIVAALNRRDAWASWLNKKLALLDNKADRSIYHAGLTSVASIYSGLVSAESKLVSELVASQKNGRSNLPPRPNGDQAPAASTSDESGATGGTAQEQGGDIGKIPSQSKRTLNENAGEMPTALTQPTSSSDTTPSVKVPSLTSPSIKLPALSS